MIEGQAAWHTTLERLDIRNQRHSRIATEGALLGAAVAGGINPELVIVSDAAGQFNVLTYALCWIHAERGIHKLVGFDDPQRVALGWARGELWAIYQALKAYQAEPSTEARSAIEARFEGLCTTKTCFESLNQALKRLHRRGAELLRTLDRPAQQPGGERYPRVCEKAQNQRFHSRDRRSALPRYLRQSQKALAQTEHLVLGLSARPAQRREYNPVAAGCDRRG